MVVNALIGIYRQSRSNPGQLASWNGKCPVCPGDWQSPGLFPANNTHSANPQPVLDTHAWFECASCHTTVELLPRHRARLALDGPCSAPPPRPPPWARMALKQYLIFSVLRKSEMTSSQLSPARMS